MDENLYGPLITLSVGVLFGWLLVTGLKRGEMEWPYFGVTLSGRRKDRPLRFWVLSGGIASISILAILATAFQIFLPKGL